jgi:hypothetical protein
MALTLLQERILSGVQDSVPPGAAEPMVPGATSVFGSVIRMTVTEDVSGNNPLAYLFTAPFGKNTEDPDGGRIEKLAWAYGLWLRQSDDSFTMALHTTALPYIAAETNLEYPVGFDTDPNTGQQVIWSPPYMEDLLVPGAVVAGKKKKPEKNLRTWILIKWWNNFRRFLNERAAKRLLRGKKVCGGGSAFLCLVGSAAAVAIVYLVAPVALQALRVIGGNPCGDPTVIGPITEITDCSTAICADGIQRDSYSGYIYTISSGRCGIYKINTCCDTVETIEEPIEPFPWTTVALVVGGVAALLVIAWAVTRDKKKPGGQ